MQTMYAFNNCLKVTSLSNCISCTPITDFISESSACCLLGSVSRNSYRQAIRLSNVINKSGLDWTEQGLTSHLSHFRSLWRRWSDCGISQDCSRSQSPQCVGVEWCVRDHCELMMHDVVISEMHLSRPSTASVMTLRSKDAASARIPIAS